MHAVVNGELYDYKELKDELSQTIGYQFSSNSDSEIVLALYQAYGPDFVNYLRGEFALCLYDETKKLFIAARDRYGIKPLSWTVQNENLLIGAEIKAFIPLDWQPEWDVKSILEAGWNFDVCILIGKSLPLSQTWLTLLLFRNRIERCSKMCERLGQDTT